MSVMSMWNLPASLCVEPKFSSDRHRPHSRLNDWHSIDYDEEVLLDLAYCDFSALKHRSCSTSTPMVKPKNSFVNEKEGGFIIASDVLKTFVGRSCKINSPYCAARDSGHEKCPQSELTADCDIFTSPLPCVSLEFDEISSSEDEDNIIIKKDIKKLQIVCTEDDLKSSKHSTDKAQVSSSLSQHSYSQCSLSSQVNSIDSGYDSQPLTSLTNFEETTRSSETCFLSDCPKGLKSSAVENKVNDSLLSKVLSQFSPNSPDVLIGRKIGIECLDIVGSLYDRNIAPALDKVCSYLSDSDLCTLCNVSNTFKLVVTNNAKARQRRQNFFKSTKPVKRNKENTLKSPKKPDRGLTFGKDGPLTSLQQTAAPCKAAVNVSPQVHRSGPVTRHLIFVEEAKKLKNDESLRKCPMCSSPAKTHTVQERACCTNERCAYDFCIKCRNPFHGAKECTSAVNKKTKTEGSVGTKKSKKNLRRL